MERTPSGEVNDMELRGKTVWLTGASSGIGEAVAYALARRGARLVLSARRYEELERVRAACENSSQHLSLSLDMEAGAQLMDAAKRAEAFTGGIDVLFNNAGISQRALVSETLPAVDRRIMEVNYFGTVALTKAVLPGMLTRRSGTIAVITSLAGKCGTPTRASYAASKHALHGYFECLRAEVWRDGIRICLICPGFIGTHLSYAALLGDGTVQGRMDDDHARAYPAARCAEDIIAGLVRGEEELLIGGREKYFIYLHRFFPGVFRRMVRRK